jgi:hypothetical protein
VIDNSAAFDINAVITGVFLPGDSRRHEEITGLLGDIRVKSGNIAHAINPDYRGKLNVE